MREDDVNDGVSTDVAQQEVEGVPYMLVSTRFACYPTDIEVIQGKKARCLRAAKAGYT